MKKLFLLFLIITMTILVSCSISNKNYYEEMETLEEPEKITIMVFLTEESIWVTHKFELNEEETLYYAPEKVKVGTKIYLNDQEQYIILKTNTGILEQNYEFIEKDQLETIFED